METADYDMETADYRKNFILLGKGVIYKINGVQQQPIEGYFWRKR